jgi:hypothetical protein
MASAMDKGNATTATVRPATASAFSVERLYPSVRTVCSLGTRLGAGLVGDGDIGLR